MHTILLATDDDSLRDAMSDVIKHAGFNILKASTTENAEHIINKLGDKIDMVLTDYQIPSKNGQKLIDFAKNKNLNIKTLMMSGFAFSCLVRKGLINKDVDFIEKPFTPEKLFELLSEYELPIELG